MITILLAALAACTTTTTTTTAGGREVVTTNEPPDNARRAKVRLELASAYFGRGQTDTALDEVKQAISADPTLAPAQTLLGLIQAAKGDDRQAEESFNRALQIDPRDADAMHNYGWFLCQRGRFEEAQVRFNAAVAQPGSRDVSRTLLVQGICQARAGALDAAEKTLSRSYEIDPANPTTAMNLAEVLYRRSELERARFYVRRVNSQPDLVSAQTLWLAARIENKLGNASGVKNFGGQLRDRYPLAPQTLQFEKGSFDD